MDAVVNNSFWGISVRAITKNKQYKKCVSRPKFQCILCWMTLFYWALDGMKRSKGLKGGKWSRLVRGEGRPRFRRSIYYSERLLLWSTGLYTRVWVFLQVTLLPTAHTLALARVELCVAVRCGWTVEFFRRCFPLTSIFMSTKKNDDDIPKTKKRTTRNQQVASSSFHPVEKLFKCRGELSVSLKEVVYCCKKTAILLIVCAAVLVCLCSVVASRVV